MLALILSIAWQLSGDPRVTTEPQPPFEAVALSWSATSDSAARVRASHDGVTWSEWKEARVDGDLTDRTEGRYFSAIVHFGAEQRFVEYAIDGEPARVMLTLFAPPSTEAIDRGTGALTLGAVPVRARSEWGCPDGQGSRWTPTYTTVTHAIVHHTAGSNDLPDWEAEMRAIWYFHTVTRGWGDIGYNFLIDPNGVVYEGRAGGDGALGAHFSCRNTNTVGVSLLGTYTNVPPTPAALKSLNAVLSELAKKNALVPAEVARHVPSGLDLARISGHRDANPSPAVCSTTTCPGDALYALLPTIRTSLDTCTAAAIEVHPSSTSATGPVTLSVIAGGTPPHSYQWYAGRSGETANPLEGATAANLTITPANAVSYWVRVTNACGSADSAAATAGDLFRRRVLRP
jgi:hypothetical protein